MSRAHVMRRVRPRPLGNYDTLYLGGLDRRRLSGLARDAWRGVSDEASAAMFLRACVLAGLDLHVDVDFRRISVPRAERGTQRLFGPVTALRLNRRMDEVLRVLGRSRVRLAGRS